MDIPRATPVCLTLQSSPHRAGSVNSLKPAVTVKALGWIPGYGKGEGKLQMWPSLLRVPWTVKRSSRSVLKEINPEYSLGGLMLKLKLQHFGHLMQRKDSFEKTLMLGKTEGGRRGRQRMRWLDGITIQHEFEQTPGDSERQGSLACCSPGGYKESDMIQQLNNNNIFVHGL